MKRVVVIGVVLAISQIGATGGGGCGTEVIRDPGFDLWCGDTLCTWKLVTGEIRKAPTWHAKDAGVEFVSSNAAIEQTSPVDSGDSSCIEFDLVANVEQTADVSLDIDVSADGSIDSSERIPTSAWKPLSFLIRIDGTYRGVRFQLTKRGAGKATLAQIAANIRPASDCAGLPSIARVPAPLGAWCENDSHCESGACRIVADATTFFGTTRACVGCDPLAPQCAAGEVCGTFEPSSWVRSMVPACTAEASDEIGERCRVDAECASGICASGVCSTCDSTRPCADGASCRLAYRNGPTTCAAGASGAPCAIDDDCTSGHCDGAERKQCADGRGCAVRDTCPVEEDGTLEPGVCTVVGVLGGTCS